MPEKEITYGKLQELSNTIYNFNTALKAKKLNKEAIAEEDELLRMHGERFNRVNQEKLEDLRDELGKLSVRHCLKKEVNGKKVIAYIEGKKGDDRYQFEEDQEIARQDAVKKLMREKTVKVHTYVTDKFPADLSEVQKDIFAGYLIPDSASFRYQSQPTIVEP